VEQSLHPGGLALTAQALAWCNLPRDARVFDLGCGAGATLNYFAAEYGLRSFGIDASLENLLCARHPGIAQAIAERLPIAAKSVDAIFAECTLSLFDFDAALRECARILTPNGYLIANDLYARDKAGIPALRELPAELCISSAMSQTQIIAQIHAHGFRLLAWQDHSDTLQNFATQSIWNPTNSFDAYLAAARAKIGYYMLIARKNSS